MHNTDNLVDLLKIKTIRMMCDIDAGVYESVREWERLCAHDRATALSLMIDGEIVTKTDLPDGSASLEFLMPQHRAVVIFRSLG